MITHRQLSILNAIVEDYVHTDQPVGSKSLIERHNLNVSPATIRNEMKQLESLNLIEKTHTSSGRSPSELGFRYYVDQLLDQTSHQQQQKIQRIREILIEHQYNISTALDAFANELSIASQYTTLVMRPNHKQDIISNIHLVRANDYLVVMVVVFTSGHVEHLHLATQSRLDNDELNKISNFVTAKYNELSTYHFENDLNSFTQSVNERKFIRDMLDTIRSYILIIKVMAFIWVERLN
jgi:heat-inducible transcriptional repressor